MEPRLRPRRATGSGRGPRARRGAPALHSELARSALVVGLPAEFVPGVADGLIGGLPLPPGTLVVDQAAFDPVGSSIVVFRNAADALRAALCAAVAGEDPTAAVRAVMAAW